jgi:hypothetical protein
MSPDEMAVPIGRIPPPESDLWSHRWHRDRVQREWSDAHDAAERAWNEWIRTPGEASYRRFRSAADREDRAQDALARVRRRR